MSRRFLPTRSQPQEESNATEKIEKLIKAIAANKIKISNISMHEPTIDDVFLKLTGSEVRDTEGEFTSARGNMMVGRR